MGVMRHAALRAQRQQIFWQELIMRTENTSWPSLSQKKAITIFRCVAFKKVIKKMSRICYGFWAAGAGVFFGAVGAFAGVAPSGRISVVVLMESSWEKSLSR